MLDLLFVGLFQAVAAEPAPAPAVTETATEEADASATTGEAAAEPDAGGATERTTRVCRTVRVTGSRLQRQRVCTSVNERDDTRNTINHMQSTGGAQGVGGDNPGIGG